MDNQVIIRQAIDLLMTLLEDDGMSFGSFLSEWYERYKIPKLKKSTLYSYDIYLKNILSSNLGHIPLSRLTGEELQDFLGHFVGNTQKKIYLFLHGCLEKAVKLRRLSYNPILSVELPSHKPKHYRPLTFEEQNKIIHYYLHQSEYNNSVFNSAYYDLFCFMCLTGIRVGEFLALDFDRDIDRENFVILVDKNFDIRLKEIITTKTENSVRRIPVLLELLPTIDKLRNQKFSYNSIRQHFKRLYVRLGIEGANVHTFRHTFVSMCYAAGISAKEIQEYVGHAEIGTTLNIYTHVLKKGSSPLYEYIRRLKDR